MVISINTVNISASGPLLSTSGSPESLRRKLEDLLRLMLVVWVKEGQALNIVTGEKCGN